MGSDGAVTVELSKDTLNDAIKQASAGTEGAKTLQVAIPAADDATSYGPQIPAVFVTADTEDEAVSERIENRTEIADLTVPSNMLNLDLVADGQNVAISIARADTSDLDPELRALIGAKPVIELKMDVDGRPVSWNNPNAVVTVSMPYTPTAEELADPEHIVIWYIDGSGKIVTMPTGRYDPAAGKVVFQVTHFSRYGVAYVKKGFDDIRSHPWAEKQIEVMASKGIINVPLIPHTLPRRALAGRTWWFFWSRPLASRLR